MGALACQAQRDYPGPPAGSLDSRAEPVRRYIVGQRCHIARYPVRWGRVPPGGALPGGPPACDDCADGVRRLPDTGGGTAMAREATVGGDSDVSTAVPPRRPTMVDVARVAGVSIKTVSRVINNAPHVQQELVDRVLSAVQELGFRRNGIAHTLRSG